MDRTARPVTCKVCKDQMYYSSDPKFEPEYRIEITDNDIIEGSFYVHRTCWHRLLDSIPLQQLDKILGLK